MCDPYSVDEVHELETAVLASFRARRHKLLNRWGAKVHFSLNAALFPYVSVQNIERVAEALRIFSPTAPCRTRSPEYSPPEFAWSAATTDYSSIVGEGDFHYLHYRGIHHNNEGEMHELIVVAIIVPSSMRRRGLFLPEIRATFRSSEHPSDETGALAHETCRHVTPAFIFFGSFTPACLLIQFEQLASYGAEHLRAMNWRRRRAKDLEHNGAPYDEGCSLAVRKSAVVLPEDRKLAWIIVIDGQIQALVDAENNELY